MTIWILGAGGQVGRALQRQAVARRIPFHAFAHDELDVRDSAALATAIAAPGAIVNAAAYTAVDRAESEPELAAAVNAEAPGHLAHLAAERGLPLIHLSTDYVFDGTKAGAYLEDDPVNPVSAYGRSKEAGEHAVRSGCARHIILRTAWIYDAGGRNFVRTVLRLGAERSELRVVADQWGGPTSADDVADVILRVFERIARPDFGNWGTYHFTGAPATTWCEFARAILAGRSVKVCPIPTAAYPTPAKRPSNSVLDCGKIKRVFGVEQPDWRISLRRVLDEIQAGTTA